MRSSPWWPMLSWSDARTSGFRVLGRMSCSTVPRCGSCRRRYSTPSFRKRRGCCWSRSRCGLCGFGLAGHDAKTGPMVTSLSWHSRSLAEDRLGETGGQPSGALAGVSAGRLVTGGAVAMD